MSECAEMQCDLPLHSKLNVADLLCSEYTMPPTYQRNNAEAREAHYQVCCFRSGQSPRLSFNFARKVSSLRISPRALNERPFPLRCFVGVGLSCLRCKLIESIPFVIKLTRNQSATLSVEQLVSPSVYRPPQKSKAAEGRFGCS